MSNPQKSIKKNFLMNCLLTLSSIIFPLITFPYVSRILSPEGIGKVSLATSIVTYFAMFAQLGIPTYGIRACAKVRDDKEELTKVVQELFIINTVMSIFTYVVFGIALITIDRLKSDQLLLLIISSTILFNDIGMEWLYKALEQYSYITIRSVLFKLIGVILMFLLVHTESDYTIYGAITIFAASASSILNFINVRKYVGFKPIGSYEFSKHFRPILIFFGMSCATTIYTNLDNVMLGFITSDADVGYYNAAVKIKSLLLGVVTSLATVLLPRASYYIEKGLKEEFIKIASKAINFVMLISVPLTVYFILFAKECIFLLSGEAFAGSILPMQIIMPTVFFIGLTNVMGIQMLIPLGKEKCVLYSEIAGAIIDLILNFILIPIIGASGAAVGTLVAELVVWIVQYLFLRDVIREVYKDVKYVSILLGVGVSVLATFWMKNLEINLFVCLMLSSILYFVVYLSIMNITKEPMVISLEHQVIDRVLKRH